MNIIPPVAITDAMLSYTNITEPSTAETSLPGYAGLWNSGTTYVLNAYVYTSTHKLYKSLQNGNVGQTPGAVGASTWWQDYGSTEKWCVFDAKVGSQASRSGSLTYEIDPGPVNGIALLNIEATSIKVTVTDVGGAGDPIVWNETTYADGLYTTDVVNLTDFTLLYLTPHVKIEIIHATGTAKIGEIVVGQVKEVGPTQYSATVGITDYSVKEVDVFGNYTILERAYSKRLSCQATVENTQLDTVYTSLATVRATPVVWVGSELYASMIVYGFFKDFSIEIPYPSVSICSLEIEGLV